jgi:hypothetical protein
MRGTDSFSQSAGLIAICLLGFGTQLHAEPANEETSRQTVVAADVRKLAEDVGYHLASGLAVLRMHSNITQQGPYTRLPDNPFAWPDE